MKDPIQIKSKEDIEELAIRMKMDAVQNKLDFEEQKYSKTIEELQESLTDKAVEFYKNTQQREILLIETDKIEDLNELFEGMIPVNIVFTCDILKEDEKEMWHLSMCIPNHTDPKEVPDEISEIIATAFFPDGCHRIETPGILKQVKHFLGKKEMKHA
jgi:hypothetical protein